jgi:ABC-type bacteriocin/lantibiotic exporter with double-glycine peptidase domain
MFVTGAVIQLCGVVAPYCSRLLIDRAYPTRDVPLMLALVLASGVTLFAAGWLRGTQMFQGRLLQADLSVDLCSALYARVLRLPYRFFCTHGAGQINSYFSQLRFALSTIVLATRTLFTSGIYLVAVPPLLFMTNVRLASIVTLSLPLTAYIAYKQAAASFHHTRRYADRLAALDDYQTATFAGIGIVKGNHGEDYCFERFGALTEVVRAAQKEKVAAYKRYNLAGTSVRGIVIGSCTYMAWGLMFSNQLTIGEFIAFTAYINLLYNPLRDLMEALSGLEEAMASVERARELSNHHSEDDLWRAPGAPAGLPVARSMSCRGLTFSYGSRPLFSAVTIAFDAGTTTAIVGRSGSGKTTLLRLLAGLMLPDSGSIAVGDVDVRTVPLSTFRSLVSVVWQGDGVFVGSLWDNLTLGRPIARSVVDRTVHLCQLDALVASLPAGYDASIGGRASRVSAGEAQRIAIARALLRDTPIILLDEMTSHLDLDLEAHLVADVLRACRRKIVICVTHRP